MLNRVATLLSQGIDSLVVAQLINNKADLGDIVVNVQILLNGNKFMDAVGNLYTENAIKNPASSNYHPDNANNSSKKYSDL